MKNRIRKILIISFITTISLFVLVISSISVYLYFNQDKIYEFLIEELNSKQQGHTEIGYIDVSPFKNFPYVSIGLHEIDFYSDKEKREPPIYHINHAYAGFDFFTMLRGVFSIKKIKIEDAYARLVIDEEGNFNLSVAKISKKDEKQEASSPLNFDFKAIHVKNFRLEETNLQGDKYFELLFNSIDAKLKSTEEYLKIKFDSDLVLNNYTSGKITYFENKKLAINSAFNYDKKNSILQIIDGELLLPNGNLDLTGSVDFKNDVDLDLELTGKKKDFDLFISFAPEDVYKNLSRFRNKGDIFFKGKIFGPSLNETPAIDILLGCENTFFFHKDNTKAIRDVSFSGRFHTGEGKSLETAELILNNLYGIPETGMFKGELKVVNFINPLITFDFHADVDLGHFKTFYDVDWLEDGGGRLKVDITIQEFADQDSIIHIASQLEDGSLSRINFENAWLKLTNYHQKIEDINGNIVFNGDDLQLENLSFKAGDSDLKMSFAINNINALLHKHNAPLLLKLHLESQKIDLANLLPKNMKTDTAFWTTEIVKDLNIDIDLISTVDALNKYKAFPEMDLFIRNFTAKLDGFEQNIDQISGRLKSSDKQLVLEKFKIDIGDNDLQVSLLIDDPYLLMQKGKEGSVHYTANIEAQKIDLKQLLVYRGEPMLSPELNDELGEELIRNFKFIGDGYLHPSTFSASGFKGNCNIELFTLKLNDLPKIANTRGRLRTDSSGCLYVENFSFTLGKSDFYAHLEMKHLLDNQTNRRNITGKIGGNYWNFDEFSSNKTTSDKTPASAENSHKADFNVFVLPFPVSDVNIDIKKLVHHKYVLEEIKGHIKTNKEHQVFIDTLHFAAAGGRIGMKGYLNGSNKDDLYMAGKIKLKNVDLDRVFFKMDNFGQDYLVNEQIHGRVDAVINAKVHLHPDLSPMLNNTEAKISMKISDGRLENFAPMKAMSDFISNRNLNNIRFGELENTINYKNGSLTIPRMKIASTLGYIHLSGRQEHDNTLNYNVEVPLSLVKSAGWNMVRSKILGASRRPKESDVKEIEEQIISEQSGLIQRYVTFNISGTTDKFDISLGGRK
jgi:hypothetical protein